MGFTHVDPFEDTERPHGQVALHLLQSFTHVDPFEDTERPGLAPRANPAGIVSPTSIRSRILKGLAMKAAQTAAKQFHPRRSVRGY